jgi:hypothetical protein
MTTYTTNKAFQEPDANSSNWNVPLNSNFVAIDAAFGTTTTATLTGTTYNLSASEIANFRIYLNGSPGSNVRVVIPITNSAGSSVGGYWVIENQITTSVTITVANSFGGNTVVVPKGYRIVLFSDPTSGVWIANDGLTQGNFPGLFSTLYTSGNVGIGQSSANGRLDVLSTGVNIADIRYSNNSNKYLGIGYSTTGFLISAVDNSSSLGLRFFTGGSSFPGNERLKIDVNGNVLVTGTGTTAGFGYGTGAGGTVTQGTSRTTSVTLNKATGAITLFTAAPTAGLGGATTFTVNNSTVAATDTVIVNVKSSTNTYLAFVSAVASTSFQISLISLTGTASDTPVINFAVIKGATS